MLFYNRQILKGINYIHECNIIHRNIKSENIVMDTSGNFRICGFHNSTINSCNINESVREFSCTPPEMSKGQASNQLVDIWCFGLVLLELVNIEVPISRLIDKRV